MSKSELAAKLKIPLLATQKALWRLRRKGAVRVGWYMVDESYDAKDGRKFHPRRKRPELVKDGPIIVRRLVQQQESAP